MKSLVERDVFRLLVNKSGKKKSIRVAVLVILS